MSLLTGLEVFRAPVLEKMYQDVYSEIKGLVRDHGNFAKVATLPTGKHVLVRIIPGPSQDMSLYYAILSDEVGKMGLRLEGSNAKFSSVQYAFTDNLKEFTIYGTTRDGEQYEVKGTDKNREVVNLKASIPTLKTIVEIAPDYFE